MDRRSELSPSLGSAQTQLVVGDIIRNAARLTPNRIAVESADSSLTFGEIDRCANRVGRGLRDLGVSFGERVAVIGTDNLNLVPAFAATAKLGAVYAPVDARLAPELLLDLLHVADPSLVVIDDELPTSARELARELGVPAVGLARLVRSTAGDDESELPVAGPGELDPQAMFFPASGTGRPKGVLISHRVHYLRSQDGALPRPRGRAVCPYALSDATAWEIVLRQWQGGGRVALVDPSDPVALCEAVGRERAEHLTASPSMLREMLAVTAADAEEANKMSSPREIELRCAAAPSELLDAIATRFPGVRLRLVYGCLEAGNLASLEGCDLVRKPGSCGVPAPFGELTVERTGELCVRGPLLFEGYFADVEATAAAVVDGWYHTGETAEIDGEGHLTILGPLREIIRTRDGAVAPIEVETAIAARFDVADVVVLGMPDPDLGQAVCAVVVAVPGRSAPLLSDVRSFCQDRLEPFKLPHRLIVVDSIPRTATTRQAKRPLLRERLV